jgi:hypothetical protein
MTTTCYISLRCRAWTGYPVSRERISVDPDGSVRVLDPVSGTYTTCHALSARATQIARRAARR